MSGDVLERASVPAAAGVVGERQRAAMIECLACGTPRVILAPPRPLAVGPCRVCGSVGWRYAAGGASSPERAADDTGYLAVVRDLVRAQLLELGIRGGRADEVVLAVNEAVAAARQHGSGDREPGSVDVSIVADGPHLDVRVRDYGGGEPHPDSRAAGLGRIIMRALAEEVTFEQTPDASSEVHMRFPLH